MSYNQTDDYDSSIDNIDYLALIIPFIIVFVFIYLVTKIIPFFFNQIKNLLLLILIFFPMYKLMECELNRLILHEINNFGITKIDKIDIDSLTHIHDIKIQLSKLNQEDFFFKIKSYNTINININNFKANIDFNIYKGPNYYISIKNKKTVEIQEIKIDADILFNYIPFKASYSRFNYNYDFDYSNEVINEIGINKFKQVINKKLNEVFDELPNKVENKIRQRVNSKIIIPVKKLFSKVYKLFKDNFKTKI